MASHGNHVFKHRLAYGLTADGTRAGVGVGHGGSQRSVAGDLHRQHLVSRDSSRTESHDSDRDVDDHGSSQQGGIITTIAGQGPVGGPINAVSFSGDGGPATLAQLNNPSGVAVDAAGSVLISDFANSRVRKVSLDGTITTIAGSGELAQGFSGDGGPATSAELGLLMAWQWMRPEISTSPTTSTRECAKCRPLVSSRRSQAVGPPLPTASGNQRRRCRWALQPVSPWMLPETCTSPNRAT